MMNFCTLFDINYLTRGLSLHNSLIKITNDFKLFIILMDDESYEILKTLNLKNTEILKITDIENDDLKNVKSSRSNVEYCWTCTPFIIKYCLNKYNFVQITYIDADLYFYSNPKILLEEMGNNSVLITEHLYSPHYFKAKIFGKYCVQFVSFKNDEIGRKVLEDWESDCIYWCYDRIENGKFGDQKYLDYWTEKYDGIHVLKNYGGLLAPWNIQQFKINDYKDILYATFYKTNKKYEVVFYHFHFIKYYTNNKIDIGDYHLTESVQNHLYKNYLIEMNKYSNTVKYLNVKASQNGAKYYLNTLDAKINRLKRFIKGTLNIYKIDDLEINNNND